MNISTPLKAKKREREREILTNDHPCTSSFFPLLCHQIRRITFPFPQNKRTDRQQRTELRDWKNPPRPLLCSPSLNPTTWDQALTNAGVIEQAPAL